VIFCYLKDNSSIYDEFSAGIILVNNVSDHNREEILLLRHTAGHWDFPKGNIEQGETELDSAIRELMEETGITRFRIMPNFRYAITYRYRRNQRIILKKVTLFLGTTDLKIVTLSNEHIDYKWEYIDKAYEIVKYKNTKRSLANVKNFLQNEITRMIFY
jgi:bis(5'-nucleosidyl)-tetraphosphatase